MAHGFRPAAICVLLLGSLAGGQPVTDRVEAARTRVEPSLRKLCSSKGLPYPLPRMFLRAIKKEHKLEVWGAKSSRSRYVLLKTYSVAGQSGRLGPKRMEGDCQVPEGFYFIDRFNPQSRFLLSLGLNYPNRSDRILGHAEQPGKDIFIHGNEVSIGCLAMSDDKIEEIYILALGPKSQGQTQIPVHIFPDRMNDRGYATLKKDYGAHPDLLAFWAQLRPAYMAFERNKRVPKVDILKDGRYRLASTRKRL